MIKAPRELQPGDMIDRVTYDLDIVSVTVSKVEKVRRQGYTVYEVHFEDYDAVPEDERLWSEHRHLRPIILSPVAKINTHKEK